MAQAETDQDGVIEDLSLDGRIRFGIKHRLWLTILAVACLTILVSFVSWRGIGQLMEAQQIFSETDVPAIVSALELSEQVAQLAASAPLLQSVTGEEERSAVMNGLAQNSSQVRQRVEALQRQFPGAPEITAIVPVLTALEGNLTDLNRAVESKLILREQKRTAQQRVGEVQVALTETTGAVLADLKAEMFEAMGAIGGEDQAQKAAAQLSLFKVYGGQGAALEFKSAINYLIATLYKGAGAQTLAEVEEFETAFFDSLATTISPLNVLGQKWDIVELERLYDLLVVVGSTGGEHENVFKIRKNELVAEQLGEEILAGTRDSAQQLARLVAGFVKLTETRLSETTVGNQKLGERSLHLQFMISGVALLAAILLAWLYVDRIVIRRLMILVDAMREIAAGDLSTRVLRDGKDELALMGRALTVLRNSGREARAAEVRHEEERIAASRRQRQSELSLAKELRRSSGAGLEALEMNASNLNAQAGLLDGLTQTTQEKSGEVSRAAEELSSNMGSVAAAVGELSQSIREISGQAGSSGAASADAVRKSEEMNANMTRLSDSSSRIVEVVGMISEIAEQTNLLALNATIEAARAGEAGKGFAVVATEVKSLADQTGRATEEIAKLVETIQADISGATEGAAGIAEVIQRNQAIATGIASAVEQQSSATSEIDRTVQMSAGQCVEVSNWIQDVASVSDEAKSSVSSVLSASQDVSAIAVDIKKAIDEFLASIEHDREVKS